MSEHLGSARRDSSSGVSQGSAEQGNTRPAARPPNGINAALSPAQQTDTRRNGQEFFKDRTLKAGDRHRCFVISKLGHGGACQEHNGVATIVQPAKGDKMSAVLKVEGDDVKYDFTVKGVQTDFLKNYNRTPTKDWKQTLKFPLHSYLDSPSTLASTAYPSPTPRTPPPSPQAPAANVRSSSSRFSISCLNGDPLLELLDVDADGNCLIHALLLCQDRNYQSLPREARLRRANELRRRAAEYIGSDDGFKEVMDNARRQLSAEDFSGFQSKLRLEPHHVSKAKLDLEKTGGGGTAAAWLDETAIAVIALMEQWDVAVLRQAAQNIPNYMTEPIPHMELFPASIDVAAGPTPLSVHETAYNNSQMAHWLRERVQQGCFVLLNFGNTHFAALLQPDEGNQAQPGESTRDYPPEQPSTRPPEPESPASSIKKKRMSDSNPSDRPTKAPRNSLWSRRDIFLNQPRMFMKFAHHKREIGFRGVDLEGEFWLFGELCQHKSLSQEVARDLAILLEHSMPEDKQSIEKILLILQDGLQSIEAEQQHADDNRMAVIKLIKKLVKRLIANAAVGRLSLRERVAILHPSSVGPEEHVGIDKDLVYASLESDITRGGNDQMIVELLSLIDDTVEEGEHLAQLAVLAYRRLPMTRAAALLSGDLRPSAEWLITEIRALFEARVRDAGFDEVLQLLRLEGLRGNVALLDAVLDRLDTLLGSSGRTNLRDGPAEEVLKDRDIINPRAWATAARHLEQGHIVSLLREHLVSLPAGTSNDTSRHLAVGVQSELVGQLNSADAVFDVLRSAKEEMDPDSCPFAKALYDRWCELEE